MIFLIAALIYSGNSSAKPIEALVKNSNTVLKAIDQCVPQKDTNKVKFCSGFSLAQEDLNKMIQGGVSSCHEEIKKLGFKVSQDKKPQELSQEDWVSFVNSTQRAMTFHDIKSVAFKKNTGMVDCVHELVHVNQHVKSKGNNSFSERYKLINEIDKELNHQVDVVEQLEKKGKKSEAQKLANSLQTLIQSQKNLNATSEDFDEIEAHLFIYENCEILKCSDEDIETVVANLYQRSSRLPKELKNNFIQKANALVKEKKKNSIATAKQNWKSLDEKSEKQLQLMMSGSWDSFIRNVKEQGVALLKIEGPSAKIFSAEKEIPEDVFSSLSSVGDEENLVLKDSKVLKGQALGKYLCRLNKMERPAIVLTKSSTLGTAVHEYGHYLQSKINDNYCEAVYGQQAIDNEFQSGKMARQEHDKKLLYLQAINALAEKEIYQFMLKHPEHLDKMENFNNSQMSQSYEKWLEN